MSASSVVYVGAGSSDLGSDNAVEGISSRDEGTDCLALLGVGVFDL